MRTSANSFKRRLFASPQAAKFTSGVRYYGFRYYNPNIGRWINREPLGEQASRNLYSFVVNDPLNMWDVLGLFGDGRSGGPDMNPNGPLGHSDFPGGSRFDFTAEDHDPFTSPFNPLTGTRKHFQDLQTSLSEVREAIASCNNTAFERRMHRLQDFWSHYNKGYRSNISAGVLDLLASMALDSSAGLGKIYYDLARREIGHALDNTIPDEDSAAWKKASNATSALLKEWDANCMKCGQRWVTRK